MKSIRVIKAGMLALAGVLLAVGITSADQNIEDLLNAKAAPALYDGSPLAQAHITASFWGSGSGKEVKANGINAGGGSLEITSNGLYTGVALNFENPIDITESFNQADAYLVFNVRVAGMQVTQQTSDNSGWGITTAPQAVSTPTSSSGHPDTKLQVMIFLDNGASAEQQVDIYGFTPNSDGFMPVSIPLSVLKKNLVADKYKIKKMVICSNGADAFWVAKIDIERDSSTLEGTAGDDKEIARWDNVPFSGKCKAQLTNVKYTWDFGEQNGLRNAAEGPVVYHQFRQAGTYTVTLTCSDVFGIKQPAKSTLTVKVNQ